MNLKTFYLPGAVGALFTSNSSQNITQTLNKYMAYGGERNN